MKMRMVLCVIAIAMLSGSCSEVMTGEHEVVHVDRSLSLFERDETLKDKARRSHFAKDGSVKQGEPMWSVICGLPQADNPLSALLSTGGYSGPWPGGHGRGHLQAKVLTRAYSQSHISTEMWLLSRGIGWWRVKAIRVHPDDLWKLSEIDAADILDDGSVPDVRQIIESPFLSRPRVVRSWTPDDEDLVNGQILSLLPDASRLRCSG